MAFADIEAETWLDSIAIAVGFGPVAERFPFEIGPSTAAVLTVLFVDAILLNLYKELTGITASFIRNPLVVFMYVTVFILVVVSRDIHRRYRRAIEEMHIVDRTESQEQFMTLFSNKIRWGASVCAAAVIYFNAVYFLTIPVIIETDGIAGIVGNFFIVPVVYVPVAIDLIITFLGIQILLPRRILYDEGFHLDFLDPSGLGGMRPFGELIKHTYYFVVFGIIVVALFVYGPWLFGDAFSAPVRPTPFVNALFTAAWLGSVGAVVHALYICHRFMNREKREALHELNNEYRNLIDNPWEIKEHQIPDSEQERVSEIRTRMERITATREYPATFAMWTQLLVGLVLPKAVQLLLATV